MVVGRWRGHLAAAAAYLGFVLLWTFPLVRHLDTHVLGQGAGDNVTSVWNFWWMRTALAAGESPFYTAYLFAPLGTDLTLNTHTALPAFAGATVLGAVPLLTAHNLTLLGMLFLNGGCAYVLAWRLIRNHAGAFIAGLVFAASPYMTAHLHGHFNLVSAWTLPLLALAATGLARGSVPWAAAAGVLLGVTAYLDYYYVVYGIALVLCVSALAARDWRLARVPVSARAVRLARATGASLVVLLVVIAVIVMSDGFVVQLGSLRVSMRDIFNPLQLFWALVWVYAIVRLGLRIRAPKREAFAAARVIGALLVMLASFALIAAPLVWNALGLIVRGEYVTQQYFWRSAPKGIDVAALVLGNPFHPVWGTQVQQLYGRAGISLIESAAWPGIVPLGLAVWVIHRHRRSNVTSMAIDGTRSQQVRQWLFLGALFFVWALGPHLMVWGANTGMILPQALLRYLPIVDNARIPGRAMVVAYLALAMLAGFAVTEWRARSRRGAVWLAAIILGVSADYLPAPFPVTALDPPPAVYEVLRDRTEDGVVLELPLGMRDGFGIRGMFDDRVLVYQTIHRRPIVGGFVARLPAAVTTAYDEDPLVAALLRMSSSGGEGDGAVAEPVSADEISARLRANGIRWVVVNRDRAPAPLLDYVKRLPLTLVAQDGSRSLYLVDVN